ncbi:MAG: hypothetical protein WAT17_02000 [Candidatus Saccharimonadales bacterium]
MVPVAESAPVFCDPLDAFEPVQLPPAVQLVGLFVTLQFSVAAPPTVTLLGEAVKVTLGRSATLPVPVVCVTGGCVTV